MKKEESITRELEGNLLTFRELEPGIEEVVLNIEELYPNQKQKDEFEDRLSQFLESDELCRKIFERKDDLLIYKTESIIPKKQDLRPPLLLLLGNPALHSVDSEMPFSFEGKKKREHRFWKKLKEAGILSFKSDRNPLRKKELYDLSYDSPFRIGLTIFYSMPSASSDENWAGVRGLEKLFHKRALGRIKAYEKARVERIIHEFLSPFKGAVFVFQKDAYEGVSPTNNYSKVKAKEGKLVGVCQCDPNVRLFCLPPTRNMYGENMLDLLRSFKESILRNEMKVK